MKATIKDVAREAGVSLGTVSRVLAGNTTVNPALRDKVEAMIRRLDYRPNSLGRNLRMQKSDIIGLVIPDVTNPFFADLAKHLEILASAAGFSVLLANTHEDPEAEKRQINSLLQRAPAGIVIAPVSNSIIAADIAKLTICVTVDRPLHGHPLVAVDNVEGGRLAAEFLLDLGHRRFGYIGGPSTAEVASRRSHGFEQAIVRASEKFDDVVLTVVNGQFDYKSGEQLGRELLSRAAALRPTAIATANDQQAIGLLRCSRDMGISVPEELSIVGFDDIPLASLVLPRLTTVRQPIEEIAELAMKAVTGKSALEAPLLLSPKLVDRETTARIS